MTGAVDITEAAKAFEPGPLQPPPNPCVISKAMLVIECAKDVSQSDNYGGTPIWARCCSGLARGRE
jgi:hypothetical protein